MRLKPEEVKETEELRQNSETRQAELKEEHDGVRKKIAELQEEIKSRQADNEEDEITIRTLQNQLVTISDEHNPLNGVIEDCNQKLANHERSTKIEELLDKQTKFWDAMQKVIFNIQEELKEDMSDFIEFVEAEEAINKVRSLMENYKFPSHETVEINDTIDQYENCIKDLCEKSVDGRKISLSEGALPIDILKKHARRDVWVKYWRKS
jgi:chromosome segregation ATPase